MINTAYLKNIWGTRYFWLQLALADIRSKYRRSMLGLAWALLQPLSLTLLLAFVMSHIFHASVNDYAPFIFSGLIFWEFLVSSTVTGCSSFVNATGYIKQFSHPLLIYTLRSVIPCMVNLLCASLGLVVWVLLKDPHVFNLSWLTLPLSYVLLFLAVWPIATISSFIGTKFHDFGQLIVIILQAIYYISPVFFLPSMFFKAHIGFLVDYNPIYHLLNLFRAPLLAGAFPTLTNYTFLALMGVISWLIVGILVYRNEHKIIFYL